jgi:transcriptional regulator with XRE-family HTH domain
MPRRTPLLPDPAAGPPLTPEDAFGRVVRERRLELKLTQADLEGEDGLERSYISRIEAGKTQACLRNILSLAEKLQMPAEHLIAETVRRMKGTP